GRAAGTPREILQRQPAARGVYGDRRQQLAQLPGAAGIEAAIGAAGQPGDLLEGAGGARLAALVEDEGGHAEQAELPGEMADLVAILLHAIADEDHRIDLLPLRLGDRMAQQAADLGLAAAAADRAHPALQLVGPAEPGKGLELAEAAVVG